MSRCFPFPPPGYVLNGSEALIESIKRAEEKAKKELRKKEKKREKKDKKRERGEGESEKHSRKRRRKEEGDKDGKNNKKVPKLKESENGCLEKSVVTVERELLQSTSQNSCDSTLNSNELPKQQKEKKQPHNNNNDSESIIRIRLPIRRQNGDPEVIKLDTVMAVSREQPQQHPCSTSKAHEEKIKDQIVRTKVGKERKLSSTTSSGLCRLCPPSMAVQFLNVIENWVPNRVELTNSEDDECWWFVKKPSCHKFDATERCKQLNRNNEMKQAISSSMAWPCARLLPEADVHALPYTVPF
ncbi:bromodomain-containing protein 3 isoform X2 [Brassica rapa]|uniref:bromodomain-containing protein 3 isoform X2 n=1 Tax=Brassica campestris TaxID=3711 RepID=UPI00142DFF03|nr:bromodomain-containing protein 3 isoform X2 [Brassica rapa]